MIELKTRKYKIFKVKEIYYPKKISNDQSYHLLTYVWVEEGLIPNITIFPSSSLHFKIRKGATVLIDLKKSLNEIWQEMHKSSCRWSIKRAQKEGVKIRINKYYDEFSKIYKAFWLKKSLNNLRSFPHLIDPNFLKNYGVLFTLEHNGEVLGGQFYIKDDSHMRLLIAVSMRLSVDGKKASLIGNGSKLAVWEAIQFAKERGLEVFDLGGYAMNPRSEDLCGINFYKKTFGGKIVKEYRYHIFNSKLLNLIYQVSDTILAFNRTNPYGDASRHLYS